MSTVGILGGTGPAGRGVAVRLASAGYDVVLGSRDAERAALVAAGLISRGTGSVSGASNDEAAGCAVVVVATPWDSAVATVSSLKEAYPPRGAMAAQISFALPTAMVVGAFHHLPAAEMVNLDSDLDADVVIFSDHAAARESVAKMVNAMPGLRAVVAGSMSLASAIEAFTAVCISINIRHKAHSYVKLAGLSH